MKTAFFLPLALALATVAAPAMAQQGVQSNKTVYRAGNWFVVRSTQATTGTVACTGYYMGEGGVQLSKDSLIVKVPGELKSIGLRFDGEPPRPPRPPDNNERQSGAVALSGPDFEQLRRSKTLVLDVATAQGRANPTLQLEGLTSALKNIDAGCPLPAASVRAERAAQRAREKAAAERCSPKGIARMKERGVHELRIKSACPKADVTPR